MSSISAVHSDIGISKANNQDSLCLKIAQSKVGHVAMGIVCDGMGGLEKGELASATVITAFSDWFENNLPSQLNSGASFKKISDDWRDLIQKLNVKIGQYGLDNNIRLGTTICAVLIINNNALMCNVGDSRAYLFADNDIKEATKDHSVVANEIEKGTLTVSQAKNDPRRSILLQCIGASQSVNPTFYEYKLKAGNSVMVCSDGFVHEIEKEEMFGILNPLIIKDDMMLKKCLIDAVDLNKSRGEKDNISVVYIKIV